MRIFSIEEKQIISDMFSTGNSIKDIMKKVNAGEKTIHRAIKEMNLTRIKPPRKSPSPDLIGTKFEYSTIIGFKYIDECKSWHMICECVCSRQFHDTLRKLKNGDRKTCGIKGCAAFHEVRKENGRGASFTGYEEIYGSRWMGWVCGARARNIEFNITPKEAWSLFIRQDRKCALSGVEIYFGNAHNKLGTASLDRIDSNLGYNIDNVQWVHKQINLMKRSCSDEEFINWCKQVVLHKISSSDKK